MRVFRIEDLTKDIFYLFLSSSVPFLSAHSLAFSPPFCKIIGKATTSNFLPIFKNTFSFAIVKCFYLFTNLFPHQDKTRLSTFKKFLFWKAYKFMLI